MDNGRSVTEAPRLRSITTEQRDTAMAALQGPRTAGNAYRSEGEKERQTVVEFQFALKDTRPYIEVMRVAYLKGPGFKTKPSNWLL
jgi:hypothetical protein